MSHLSNDQMSGYARRTLDAEALLMADDHLSTCDECRNRLIDVEGLKDTVESLRRDLRTALDAPTGHLPYDQIEARAEGRLRGAAREVAETHIEHCSACARQARDLEAFASAFRARAQEQAAASAAASFGEQSTAVRTPSRGSASPATSASATGASAVRPGHSGAATATRSESVAAPGVSATPAATARRPPAAATEVSPAAAEALVGAGATTARSRLWPIFFGLLTALVVAAAILGRQSMRERIGLLNHTVEDLSRRNEELADKAAQVEERNTDPEMQQPQSASLVPGAGAPPTQMAAVGPAGRPGSGGDAGPPGSPATDPAPSVPSGSGPAGSTGEAAAFAPPPEPSVQPPGGAAETPPAAPSQAPATAPATAPAAALAAAPAAPAVPAIALQDQRGTVGLDGNGRLLGLDGVPPGEAKTIATALKHGSLEVPDEVRTLSTIPKSIEMDDNAAGMALTSGASTVVRTTRPTLSWQPVEGAQAYTLVLFNAQGRPLYYGGPTGETWWTPPAPLQRGVIYTWRVAAYRPSETQAAARGGAGATPPPSEKLAGAVTRFKVIDAASASGLERALRAAPASRVVAGVLYARAGLLDDAGREFSYLVAKNPDSGLAKALLASVEAARLP
jgi:hypothetical protein